MVHYILQGEGGEQGDALMPLLFAVGQHKAFEIASGQFFFCDHQRVQFVRCVTSLKDVKSLSTSAQKLRD